MKKVNKSIENNLFDLINKELKIIVAQYDYVDYDLNELENIILDFLKNTTSD